ncbi:hypothetical protein [Williamsia sp. DF01-3]|uniref:hypothetical protein n=1 Tax=Williamsia sp. DF01-3 TaxID=2934157 RepID=UPI0027E2EADB|nr:hypothetical protein [Williamsia sp. DF01-3]
MPACPPSRDRRGGDRTLGERVTRYLLHVLPRSGLGDRRDRPTSSGLVLPGGPCRLQAVESRCRRKDYQEFVTLFYEFWSGRRGLLETIVAAEVDEDPRYFRVLLRLMMSVTYALAPAVRTGHAVGVAGSLVVMLTSSAARVDGFARDGVPFDDLVSAQVLILRASLQSAIG